MARSLTVSPAWRFALAGAVVSVPLTLALNRIPAVSADPAAGITLLGAAIAGMAAVGYSADPGPAGFRAGLLAVSVAVGASAITLVREGPSRSGIGLLLLFSIVATLFIPAFGWICGRFGGWLAEQQGHPRVPTAGS
jgi:hypothetical protein